MAYLHCHKCGWSQDDFWSETYSPLSRLIEDGLLSSLLSEKWLVVDADWLRHSGILFKDVRVSRLVRQRDEYEPTLFGQPESALVECEQYEVEPRAYIVEELRRRAKNIEDMRWRTHAEWKKDYDSGKAKCPRCGSNKDFDID
jgi:hypothetical protein